MRRVLVALLPLAAACAGPEIVPAPAANAAPGPGRGAVALEEGVRVEARFEAWEATPEDLDDEVTPVLVRIRNESDRPLRVAYDELALATAAGGKKAALPVWTIEGSVVESVPRLGYPTTGFAVAPHLSPYYPGMAPWAGPFTYDPSYYGTYYPSLVRIALPTPDMVQAALPEGVLAPGGDVSGFVYFEEVGGRTEALEFRLDLVDAETGEPFGSVDIPFVVKD